MERIRLLFEQLEEAKRLMMRGTLLDTRLALILLDNAAELLMYRELRYQFAWDDSFALPSWLPKVPGVEYPLGPSYTKEERRKAEDEFKPKVKLLTHHLHKISIKQAGILRVCHEMRNDAFHREELNPEILRPTTELLFLTVAELARDFPIHSYSLHAGTQSEENAAFLKRFGLDSADHFGNHQVSEKMYTKLVESVGFDCTLSKQLSEDMTNRLDGIIESLAYVNDDETDEQKLDHNLRYTQFWRERGNRVMQEAHKTGKYPKEELDRAYLNWSQDPGPRYTIPKIKRRRVHASAIAKMTHPSDALVTYAAIERWMAPLEEDVRQAVSSYEQHIDAMIEEAQLRRVFGEQS